MIDGEMQRQSIIRYCEYLALDLVLDISAKLRNLFVIKRVLQSKNFRRSLQSKNFRRSKTMILNHSWLSLWLK